MSRRWGRGADPVGPGGDQRAALEAQGVGAGTVQPGGLPGRQVLAGGGTDGPGEVLQAGVAPGVVAEVGLQAGEERVLTDVRAELLEDRLALLVGDRVEVRHRLRHVGDLAADGVAGGAHVHAVALELAAGQRRRPAVAVLRRADRRPGGGPRREGLVEPEVVPPLHGHQVAEPHVRHLVQDDRGEPQPLRVGGRAAEQQPVAVRHAAPVLHRATHVGHEHLVVLLLGERHAELLAEPGQALLGQLEQLVGVAVEQAASATAGSRDRGRGRRGAAGSRRTARRRRR